MSVAWFPIFEVESDEGSDSDLGVPQELEDGVVSAGVFVFVVVFEGGVGSFWFYRVFFDEPGVAAFWDGYSFGGGSFDKAFFGPISEEGADVAEVVSSGSVGFVSVLEELGEFVEVEVGNFVEVFNFASFEEVLEGGEDPVFVADCGR